MAKVKCQKTKSKKQDIAKKARDSKDYETMLIEWLKMELEKDDTK